MSSFIPDLNVNPHSGRILLPRLERPRPPLVAKRTRASKAVSSEDRTVIQEVLIPCSVHPVALKVRLLRSQSIPLLQI